MSHKILAEKYAQQLNDAQKRILELESTVADREFDLEQAKVGSWAAKTEDTGEMGRLRGELVDKDARIAKLDRQMKEYLSTEREMSDSRLSNVQGQLELATERVKDLEGREHQRHERLLQLQIQLKTVQDRATADARTSKEHVRSIEAWAKAEVDRVLQQKQQAVRELEAERASHEAQSGPSSERIKFLEKALETSNRLALSQSAESLRIENDHLVKCIRETSGEKFDLRRKVTKLTKEYQRASQADSRVKELETRLRQERKRTYVASVFPLGWGEVLTFRRVEAEAMLGPAGKRCLKCNPIIVDLMAEDEDNAGGESDSDSGTGRDAVEMVF